MRRLSVGFVMVAAALFMSHPSTLVHAAGLAASVVVFADGSGTRTSPSFSVSPGDVVVAFVASDGPLSGGQTMTVSGGGLTWNLIKRVNVQAGTSEIWRAIATSALSNVTATSTPSLAGYYQSLTVVTFSGASGAGATGGASAASGAPTVALTTTAAGSLVYGVGNDWDTATPRTLGAGQALVHQYAAPAGDLFWMQNQIAPSSAAGVQVQLNDIAPTIDRWNFASVEIVPAGPPGFEVKPYNDSIALGLSDALAYNLLLDPFGGFTGSVFLYRCGFAS